MKGHLRAVEESNTVIAAKLSGVPETMLWTLHNRASEAARTDGVLRDPRCIEIYRALAYDYERSFGAAEPSHGIRSSVFDDAVRAFVREHPDAVIVNLGEGLETQRFRVEDGDSVLWVSVDVPEAMAIRERFIAPDARHLHVPKSALDTSWFDVVPQARPVFVTAQGLFMYFDESAVRELLTAVSRRWPRVEVMFDYIPRWLSNKSSSEKGWWKTTHYRVPKLPWGVHRSEVVELLGAWLGELTVVSQEHYVFPRGLRRWLFRTLTLVPWIRERAPGMIRVRVEAAR